MLHNSLILFRELGEPELQVENEILINLIHVRVFLLEMVIMLRDALDANFEDKCEVLGFL